MSTHEDLSRKQAVKQSSDKFFGLTFFVFFLAIALLPIIHGNPPRIWAGILSALFFLLALLAPKLLAPANSLWLKFGALLHAITSPIILGIMFYLVITPIGLIMRAMGKDLLRLKLDRECRSYWIEREPPGPEKNSLNRQF